MDNDFLISPVYNYAQIDEQGYCIGLSTLTGEVDADNMILLSESDIVQFGQKYDTQNKVWLDEVREQEPLPNEITLTDVKQDTENLKEDNLIVMSAQAEQYEEQQALKQDVLAIMGAIAELYEMVTGGSK